MASGTPYADYNAEGALNKLIGEKKTDGTFVAIPSRFFRPRKVAAVEKVVYRWTDA